MMKHQNWFSWNVRGFLLFSIGKKSIFMTTYCIECSYKGLYNWFAASLLAQYKFLVEMQFMVFLLVIRLYRNLLRFALCILLLNIVCELKLPLANAVNLTSKIRWYLVHQFSEVFAWKINVLISLDIQKDNLVHNVKRNLLLSAPKILTV